jgi:hypothetical protein
MASQGRETACSRPDRSDALDGPLDDLSDWEGVSASLAGTMGSYFC